MNRKTSIKKYDKDIFDCKGCSGVDSEQALKNYFAFDWSRKS